MTRCWRNVWTRGLARSQVPVLWGLVCLGLLQGCGSPTITDRPVIFQSGEIYVQDVEGLCFDWFIQRNYAPGLDQDVTTSDPAKHDRWKPPVAVFTGADTEADGPYYLSWLDPVQVTSPQSWQGRQGQGLGLVFGIHCFGPDYRDLDEENILMGPRGYLDPEMGLTMAGPTTGVGSTSSAPSHVPADTHSFKVFANIDWRFIETEPEPFRLKEARLDGDLRSRWSALCEGCPLSYSS